MSAVVPAPVTRGLSINGSMTGITVSQVGTLNWSVTGETPNAVVQLQIGVSPTPGSGTVVASATADANGNASGTYQLSPSLIHSGGATAPVLYAFAYDGTQYSNSVAITTAPPGILNAISVVQGLRARIRSQSAKTVPVAAGLLNKWLPLVQSPLPQPLAAAQLIEPSQYIGNYPPLESSRFAARVG